MKHFIPFILIPDFDRKAIDSNSRKPTYRTPTVIIFPHPYLAGHRALPVEVYRPPNAEVVLRALLQLRSRTQRLCRPSILSLPMRSTNTTRELAVVDRPRLRSDARNRRPNSLYFFSYLLIRRQMCTLLAEHLDILYNRTTHSVSLLFDRRTGERFPHEAADGLNVLFCVISSPKRRRSVMRCRDHLSSGEKRAGCADFVTWPSSTFFSVYRRPVPLASGRYMRCIAKSMRVIRY